MRTRKTGNKAKNTGKHAAGTKKIIHKSQIFDKKHNKKFQSSRVVLVYGSGWYVRLCTLRS